MTAHEIRQAQRSLVAATRQEERDTRAAHAVAMAATQAKRAHWAHHRHMTMLVASGR